MHYARSYSRCLIRPNTVITNCLLLWMCLNVLRRMNCIIFVIQFGSRFSFHGAPAPSGPGYQSYGGFSITIRNTTLGRSPLDEWSSRYRDFYQTTQNTHTGHPCLRRDWNPQSQQDGGPWHTPYTARAPGSAISRIAAVCLTHVQIKCMGVTVESTSQEKYNLGECRSTL